MTSGPLEKKGGQARSPLRKSSLALILAATSAFAVALLFTHAHLQRRADGPAIAAVARVVADLELTDLALFTEARYTRHLSQADLHSAFQDHPAALEHFPAGSLAGPPAGLRRHHAKPD